MVRRGVVCPRMKKEREWMGVVGFGELVEIKGIVDLVLLGIIEMELGRVLSQ